MFESTGLQPRRPSVRDLFEAAAENRRLRRYHLIDFAITMPLCIIAALKIAGETDLPSGLIVVAVVLVYGVLSVLTLWIYDLLVPPATERELSDYVLLVIENARHSVGPVLVALAGVAFSLMTGS